MGDFKMPSLGADMRDGTLLEWKVEPGDRVKRGDIIAEVATDKGDIEIEVFEDGVVSEILVEPGTLVPVGEVLARIDSGAPPQTEPDAPVPPGEPRVAVEPVEPVERVEPVEVPERVRASPVARKLAEARGLDLSTIRGTGSGGAVTREDVIKASAETGPEAKEPPQKARRMRLAIAGAMARSNREIPHYYLETRIDMKPCLDWLAAKNGTLPIDERVLPVVALLKAVARGLREVPELNGYWVEDRLETKEAIHIGFALSLRGGGLVTPAIHDVDRKSLPEIMASLRDLVPRARAGRLRGSELSDATITVTSLGDLGVESVYGVIYPPQVALVGFGKIVESPWAEGGMLGIRPVVSATLAADHRATDGARGAAFLDSVARHLRKPETL